MSQFKKFDEYLNSKGTLSEKPKVTPDGDNIDVPASKIKAKEDPTKKKSKARPQIKEYLGPTGKLVEKPKVADVADYDGPNDTKPPKAVTSGKGWEAPHAEPADKEVSPYRSPIGSKPGANSEKGFGELGDQDLIYKPDTAKAKLPKTKTEQFMDKTKGMSLGEFTHYVLEQQPHDDENLPTVTAYQTGAIRPYPAETIRYVVALTEKSDRIMQNLIHEVRRSGQLKNLLTAIMDYPETYQELAGLLEGKDGMKRAQFLARAIRQMTEAVGPPMGFDDEGEEDFNPGEVGDDEGDEREGDEDLGSELGDEGMGDEDENDFEDEEEDEEPESAGEPNDDESFPSPEGGDMGGQGSHGGPGGMRPPRKKPNLSSAMESYGLL